jgi:hypothetical protein
VIYFVHSPLRSRAVTSIKWPIMFSLIIRTWKWMPNISVTEFTWQRCCCCCYCCYNYYYYHHHHYHHVMFADDLKMHRSIKNVWGLYTLAVWCGVCRNGVWRMVWILGKHHNSIIYNYKLCSGVVVQGLSNFVIPLSPKLIYTFAPPPLISACQRKVQFCTLLQVPITLYGDNRNINDFTASLHIQ